MFVCKKGPNFFENSRSGFGPALHRIQNGNRAIRFQQFLQDSDNRNFV